ncbi:hypothetical protein BD779DRAFT_1678620 [Infundibulicybe gibba]|nr:hypothetical protein BD779DRAFT_1678620 [Infundibulicybe gibba]
MPRKKSRTQPTAKGVSIRPPRRRSERLPITTHQRAVNSTARRIEKEKIDQAVSAWFAATIAKADELAERFGKKRRHFLDLFFHGGARMVMKRRVVNSWNAWTSLKAKELNADTVIGKALNLQEIHQERGEYDALTVAEKKKMVDRYINSVDTLPWQTVRVNARSQALDMLNVVWNMELLLKGLKTRVGAEGFFRIVRSSTSFHADPQWFFSSPEFANYMPIAMRGHWDSTQIGARLEAFALAGSNITGLLNSSKKKADYLKGRIADKMRENLVSITGNQKATMSYANFTQDIVMRYGIDLEGWTHPTFANPSQLSTSLPPLQQLHDALQNGTCKFYKLTVAEREQREKEFNEKVKNGDAEIRPRKMRKDAGTKWGSRKRKRADDDEVDSSDEAGNRRKRRAEIDGDEPESPNRNSKGARGGRRKRGRVTSAANVPEGEDASE